MTAKYQRNETIFETAVEAGLGGFTMPVERSRKWPLLKISAAVVALAVVAAVIGGYAYWRSLKSTPQYSLALAVDAARRGDQAELNGLVDSDAAVDDFLPQITSKAIELYGRGLPPETLQRIERLAAPLMPAVKDRARDELPRLIREKTAGFEKVPFAAMVLGADRYLDITVVGDQATVKSKLPEHSFDVKMSRNGERWKIVGIRDEKMATVIAQKIGQEIIAVANSDKNGVKESSFKDFKDIMQQAQEIFKK